MFSLSRAAALKYRHRRGDYQILSAIREGGMGGFMKILVIEDKKYELERAREAVEKAGHTCIPLLITGEEKDDFLSQRLSIRLMEEVDAVITDLHFPCVGCYSPVAAKYKESPPPAGLLVAIVAISFNKPVVICTRCDDGLGHHGVNYAWIYDGLLNTAVEGGLYNSWGENWDPPLCIVTTEGDKKDWELAVRLVVRRVSEGRW